MTESSGSWSSLATVFAHLSVASCETSSFFSSEYFFEFVVMLGSMFARGRMSDNPRETQTAPRAKCNRVESEVFLHSADRLRGIVEKIVLVLACVSLSSEWQGDRSMSKQDAMILTCSPLTICTITMLPFAMLLTTYQSCLCVDLSLFISFVAMGAFCSSYWR